MKVHQGDVNDGHQIDDSVGPSDFDSECYTLMMNTSVSHTIYAHRKTFQKYA